MPSARSRYVLDWSTNRPLGRSCSSMYLTAATGSKANLQSSAPLIAIATSIKTSVRSVVSRPSPVGDANEAATATVAASLPSRRPTHGHSETLPSSRLGSLHERRIRLRQVHAEEVDLAANPADHADRLAKIHPNPCSSRTRNLQAHEQVVAATVVLCQRRDLHSPAA